MRKLNRQVLILSVVILNVAVSVACSSTQQRQIKSAIDVGCIIANATLPDERVKEICKVADDAWPLVVDILSAERTAAAARATRDGGCDGR